MNIVQIESIKVLSPYKFEIVDARPLFTRIYDFIDNNPNCTPEELSNHCEISLFLSRDILSRFI